MADDVEETPEAVPDPSDPQSSTFWNRDRSNKELGQALQLDGVDPHSTRIAQSQVHKAMYDKSLTTAQRVEARNQMKAMMNFYGIGFDWAQWRKEMDYEHKGA